MYRKKKSNEKFMHSQVVKKRYVFKFHKTVRTQHLPICFGGMSENTFSLVWASICISTIQEIEWCLLSRIMNGSMVGKQEKQ